MVLTSVSWTLILRGSLVPAADRRFVLALFASEVAADVAARSVAQGAPGSPGGRCSVGVLTKDERGRITDERLGAGQLPSSEGVGLVLGRIANSCGGASPAGVDPVHERDRFLPGSDLTMDDIARIGAELDSGSSVVGVLAETAEAAAWALVELAHLGGKAESHVVPQKSSWGITEVGEVTPE